MNTVKEYRTLLERRKGQRDQLAAAVHMLQERIRDAKRSLRRHEQAREIIREVGMKTQEQLSFHISDITSLAMEAVFSDPYELRVEFVQRRNKTECDLLFYRDGNAVTPIDASGGGAVDVAAFALRIAAWSMQRPHSRAVMIMDEPFRFLSNDMQERASEMIKQVSERLGIQFIIITHNETLATAADNVFEVSIRRGVSKVTQS